MCLCKNRYTETEWMIIYQIVFIGIILFWMEITCMVRNHTLAQSKLVIIISLRKRDGI